MEENKESLNNQLINEIEVNNLDKVNKILAELNSSSSTSETKYFDINETFTYKEISTTLADLAWSLKHMDILVSLLETNSMFPKKFIFNFKHFELKNFCTLMHNFRKAISQSNYVKLTEIIHQKPNLRHFYDSKNVPAYLCAVNKRNLETLNFLEAHDIKFDSNMNIFEKLNAEDKKRVRESLIEFQGVEMQLKNLFDYYNNRETIESYAILSGSQIIEILDGKTLKIGEEVKFNFCAVRRSIAATCGDYFHGVRIDSLRDLMCFEEHETAYHDILILSDLPKSGKTSLLKYFLLQHKSTLSRTRYISWNSYLDMRKLQDVEFNTYEDVLKMFCKNKFEEAVFSKVCTYSNVIWDNIDDLEEKQREKLMKLLSENKTKSGIHHHWIVTEPKFEDEYKEYPHGSFKLSRFECKEFYLKLKLAKLLGCEIDYSNNDSSSEQIVDFLEIHEIGDKIHAFVEFLESIKFFDRSYTNYFNIHFLDLVAKFAYSTNLNLQFKNITDFFIKLIDFSFDHKFLGDKSFQYYAIKSFIEKDENYVYEFDVTIDTFLKYSPLPEQSVLLNDLYEDYPRLMDVSLNDFFIAKFFVENIFEKNDHSSEEASFLVILLIKKSQNILFKRFVCELLELKNVADRKASAAIHQSPELKNALKEDFNFNFSLSEFFAHDKEALNALWNINENETYYMWWIRENYIADKKNKFQIKGQKEEILRSLKIYFNENEIERMKVGKHQMGNFLYQTWKDACIKTFNYVSMNEYNKSLANNDKSIESESDDEDTNNATDIMDIEIVNVENEDANQMELNDNVPLINQKQQLKFKELRSQIYENTFDFFEFLKLIELNLSSEEVREVFRRNSFEIFRHFVKNLEQFNLLWLKIEKLFNFNEISEMLKPQQHRKICIYHNSFHQKYSKLLKACFEKFDKYLDSKSIKYHLTNQNPILFAVSSRSKEIIETFLHYCEKYQIELKTSLLEKSFFSENQSYSFNILELVAISGDEESFKFVLELCKSKVTQDEFKNMIQSFSRDFLFYLISDSTIEICKEIATLIETAVDIEEEKFDALFDSYLFEYYSEKNIYGKKIEPFLKILNKCKNDWLKKFVKIDQKRNELI